MSERNAGAIRRSRMANESDFLAIPDDPRTTREALLAGLGRVGIHPPEGEGEPWIVTTDDPQPCSEGDSLADAIRETVKLLAEPAR
jgi:hypothetical protein